MTLNRVTTRPSRVNAEAGKQETMAQREGPYAEPCKHTHTRMCPRAFSPTDVHTHASMHARAHTSHTHKRTADRKACGQTNTFPRGERVVLQQNRTKTPTSWDEIQFAALEPCQLPPKPASGSAPLTWPEHPTSFQRLERAATTEMWAVGRGGRKREAASRDAQTDSRRHFTQNENRNPPDRKDTVSTTNE